MDIIRRVWPVLLDAQPALVNPNAKLVFLITILQEIIV